MRYMGIFNITSYFFADSSQILSPTPLFVSNKLASLWIIWHFKLTARSSVFLLSKFFRLWSKLTLVFLSFPISLFHKFSGFSINGFSSLSVFLIISLSLVGRGGNAEESNKKSGTNIMKKLWQWHGLHGRKLDWFQGSGKYSKHLWKCIWRILQGTQKTLE